MRLRIFIFALAVSLVAGAAAAQQTGQVFGKVTDASGAVVPGVAVTLTGGSLIAPQTAVTSATGTYQFPQLPIGNYTVKFELTGFKTIVREGIRIEIGFNAQINATMEVSTVQETVTVSGAAPVVDLRDTSKTTRFTQEALQSIPSARDPWVIVEQSAGVAMDRQNVGGSASGQQSNFVARGAAFAQQKWNLDGVDITDMSATGGSPNYFDFDAFEEMQISAGGADVRMMTPGVSVNLVTKSGTDRFKGSGRYYITDQKFESKNITQEMRLQGATSGNPIQNIKDYGAEVGGPIKRGRAWFWGAIGKQAIDVGINNFYSPAGSCAQVKTDYANKMPTADFVAKYSIQQLWDCLNTDETLLNNYNAKVGLELFRNNQFNFYFNGAEKIRNARGADDLHPIEATNRQMGVTNTSLGSTWWKLGMNKTYKWSDRWILTDRLLMEVQAAHVGNNFVMDFHSDDLATVQPTYEIVSPAGLWGRSYSANTYVRPTASLDVTANYFKPGFMGGDHAFVVGFKWRNDEALSMTHYGGFTVARFRNGLPSEAQMYRDSRTDYLLFNRNVYVQDTYTHKRLTINAGIRFDVQGDQAMPATVAQHPFFGQATGLFDSKGNYLGAGPVFNQLPTVTFGGALALGTADHSYRTWSPRVSMTYDLTGNGRNVLKANYARYVAQAGTGDMSSSYNPLNVGSVRYPWYDLNRDTFVQPNELQMVDSAGKSKLITWGGNYDPNNPNALTSPYITDPNISIEHTDEFIATFDKQIAADFAVGASFIYRKTMGFRGNVLTDGTFTIGTWGASNWQSKTYTADAATCPPAQGARCPTITYYEPTSLIPSTGVYTNIPDAYRTFKGLEFYGRKRMSQRWMMNASFSYNDAPVFMPTPASYAYLGSNFDPSNVPQQNGGQYAPQSTSSGIDNVFVNAKWIGRISGSYTLPWYDINVAGFWNARGGFPYMPVVQYGTNRPFGAGTVSVYLDKIGDVRLPTFQQFDFRVDKTFRIGPARFVASLDGFNLFNVNTVLSQRRTQNASNANQISSIVAPRVLRFGVRMTF